MAFGDPPTPTTAAPAAQTTPALPGASLGITQEDFDKANKLSESYTNIGAAAGNVSNFSAQASQMLDKLSDSASRGSVGFGVLSAGLLGAQAAFRGFNGAVDDSRVNDFSSQFKQLSEDLKSSPVGSVAHTAALSALSSMMKAAGASSEQLGHMTLATAEAFLKGADNMLHLQNAMTMSSAAGGAMTEFLQAAGKDLENLNDITLKAAQVQNTSRGATGMSREEMQKYLNDIKDIPGGLLHMGDSIELATGKTTLLTAAIQYADGAGRAHKEVIKDITDGMVEYGMTMEGGLRYSARMSEVSETLHARTGDVDSAMKSAADNFKSYIRNGQDASTMTDGMSKSMEEYVARLQSIGVPTKQAIEMFGQYNSQLAQMTLGQKAFLSAQTGGPGGLRGALQMEDLMGKDPEAAQKKVMETIQKMTGPIVSREKAEQSEGAAAQYTRQMQLLMQGPMGAQVKDTQQAAAMMEAMSKGQTMPLEKGRSLEETIKTGQQLEQTKMTQVQQMDVKAESVQIAGAKAALDFTQNTMAGRSGSRGGADGTGAGVNVAGQEQIKGQQASASTTLPGHEVPVLKDIKDYLTTLPEGLKNAGKAAMESFAGNNQATPQQIKDAIIVGIQNQAISSGSKSDADMAQKVAQHLSAGAAAASAGPGAGIKLGVPHGSDYYNAESVNAGAQVGKAIGTSQGPTTAAAHVGQAVAATTTPPPTTGGGTAATAAAAHAAGGMGGGASTGPVPVTLVGSTLTVNFTGKCPHCGTQVHTSEHATVNNAASTR